ncbi:MAG: hypothetical protein AB7U75_19935 [Hyphomicrobiaceae bacterium]
MSRVRASLRNRPPSKISSIPGFADMPEDATADQLYARCAELRWKMYGSKITRSKRYFHGPSLRSYVEHFVGHGVTHETLRESFALTPAQWRRLMDPAFTGNLTIKPTIKDEGPDTFEELDLQ